MLGSRFAYCCQRQKEFAIERGKLLAARMEAALGFDDMRDAVLQGRIRWKVCLLCLRISPRLCLVPPSIERARCCCYCCC